MAALMTQGIGEHLRLWRRRRRLSQLTLALEAEISQRHLSFVESGRAAPSRGMVLRLAERLDVPLRDRNALLLAAGYAPAFRERRLDDPSMETLRAAVEQLLTAHEPFPALAIDRHWNMLASNRMIAPLIAGVAPRLLEAPVNVLRLTLDPEGLAPRIANLGEWRGHLLARLQRQRDRADDAELEKLHEELRALPGPAEGMHDPNAIAVPLRLRSEGGVLSFLSATLMFGAPLDVTLAEIAVETFLPADAHTAEVLRTLLFG